nr:TIGR02270 family protein [uncultured Caldimonas sp.]
MSMNENLQEYHDEAQFLWLQRCYAVDAPNYAPDQLVDLDDQLSAQIDGLRAQPDGAWPLCVQALGGEGAEEYFVASVLALTRPDRWHAVLERAVQAPEVLPGVASALGWVGPSELNGVVKELLVSSVGLCRSLGIAACAMHRQDPGMALRAWLGAESDAARVRAVRAAGELGRVDVLQELQGALTDPKPEARYWAAWSVTLLGNPLNTRATLHDLALKPGRRQRDALLLLALTSNLQYSHEFLAQLEGVPDVLRMRIMGAGRTGNPRYVPWLIEQMEQPATARIAGEAFAWITGADFNLDQLEGMPPEGHEDGPTDDPEDEDVTVPEDIALPWPDVPRVKAWWSEHRGRFTVDQKLFFGQPLNAAHCQHVLRTGMQRPRVAAAVLLAMLQPEAPLFPTSAPAWRQQRAMAAWTE